MDNIKNHEEDDKDNSVNYDDKILSAETASVSDDLKDSINIQEDFDIDEDLFRESLKKQVNDELDKQQLPSNLNQSNLNGTVKKKSVWKKVFIITGSILASLLICCVLLVGTKTGRRILYKIAGNYIYNSVDKQDNVQAASNSVVKSNTQDVNTQKAVNPNYRQEDYVSNYLIFGVEEIGGAKNTDSMIIVSINTKDNTIKLTSLLRDTYIDIPGYEPDKLNSFFSKGGTDELITAIEETYRINIDGYAWIDFDSFEKIVDYLGGISVELGEKEANYLNTTNYITLRSNRNVTPGWNLLNGDQALGYCRVRKVVTLGGVNNDYGRTLRQRRVLNAIFDKYKSKSIFDLLPIMNTCLGYVKTNLTKSQIQKILEDIVENKIRTMDTFRVPVDGKFTPYEDYNGVNDPLVMDRNENIIELYKFVFLDTDAQAQAALTK